MTIIIDCFTPSQGTIHLLSPTWTGKKCLPFLHLVVHKDRCSPIFCCTCLSFFTTKCLVYFCKLINMLRNMCFLLQLKTIVREFSSVCSASPFFLIPICVWCFQDSESLHLYWVCFFTLNANLECKHRRFFADLLLDVDRVIVSWFMNRIFGTDKGYRKLKALKSDQCHTDSIRPEVNTTLVKAEWNKIF
jgi:hypothetical protein